MKRHDRTFYNKNACVTSCFSLLPIQSIFLGCNVHIDEYIRRSFQFPSEFMSLMVQWTQQKLILVLWLWTRLRCRSWFCYNSQKMLPMILLTCRWCRSWFCEHAEDVAHEFVNMQKMSLMILWKRRRCRSWFCEHAEDVAHDFVKTQKMSLVVW